MSASDLYNSVASEYSSLYSKPIYQAEDDHLKSILRPYFNGGTVLDVGCGDGYFLDHIYPTSAQDYLGFDISTGMLAQARKRHPEHSFVERDMEEPLPFPGGYFDRIVSLWLSFNYSLRPRDTLIEFSRLLAPSGIGIVQVAGPLHEFRKSWIMNDNPVPYLTYTPIIIENLFGAFFYEVEIIPYQMLGDMLPASLPVSFYRWCFKHEQLILKRWPSLATTYIVIFKGARCKS